MKQAALFVSLVLLTSLPVATGNARPENTKTQTITIDFFDVPDAPISFNDTALRRTPHSCVLKFSAFNRTDEKLLGVRLILLILDLSGKLRHRVGMWERVELAGYSIKEFSFELPKLKVKDDERAVLEVEQVIGPESIWTIIKAEDALKAYAAGEQYILPEVRRVSNHIDVRPGTLL